MECSSGTIDLHVHSTASDGSLHPEQILDRAVKNGLAAISITDHDTVVGVEKALCHGIPETLEFITGIEISAAFPPSFKNSGSLHILGYGIRTDHPELRRMLEKQRSARSGRNPLIIKKLNNMGIPASLEAIAAATGKKEVARPHIAEYLVKTGYATDIDDAFDRLLGKGKPAYVDKYRVDAETAIKRIQAAGGIAVLAHPMLLFDSTSIDRPDESLENLLEILISCGLSGIEAYYPGHSASQTSFLINAAEKRSLLVTGGTDFHGDINPDIEMGSGRGDLSVPYEIFTTLKNALAYG